ncbi:TPM domain-containing protein [Dechloromonas denitrificans]|uniref:TPM domain-containing protein n=1 Tax=Dechloromonas denitrificans TaxID=281362 RepID=UPI001CF882D3|nr:YgcG family protein [Dechloromonas denitrificans]
MKRLAAHFAALLLCLFSVFAWAAPEATGLVALPGLTARVTDLTGSLDNAQRAGLEQKLAAFEASKGAQVVVLVLPSTQPETIEQFGIRLFDAWKVGRKGIDDGVMLIVAKDDRRLRIEVGYGLEGALNDATAKRIISETITPQFKAGNIPGGIEAGVDAILKVVDGESLPEPSAPQGSGPSFGRLADIPETMLIGVALVIVVGGTILRQLLGNLLGCTVAGGLSAGLGWLLVGGLAGVIGGAVIGILLAVFGLDILLSGVLNGRSGGGSGGGGFSGGGGSGGGGGASGSW